MTMIQRDVSRALQLLQQAVDLDACGELDRALDVYCLALEAWEELHRKPYHGIIAISEAPTDQLRSLAQTRLFGVLDRCEKLKHELNKLDTADGLSGYPSGAISSSIGTISLTTGGSRPSTSSSISEVVDEFIRGTVAGGIGSRGGGGNQLREGSMTHRPLSDGSRGAADARGGIGFTNRDYLSRSVNGGHPAPPIVNSGDSAAEDFKQCLVQKAIRQKNQPRVTLADVAGMESAKQAIHEAVILPQKYSTLFSGNRRPWQAILLYGPPGTGKTHLAQATAHAVDATFFSVSSSDLLSKWMGESERFVRALFEAAADYAPSVIFIDEVDSLCSTRNSCESDSSRRVKNELLVQIGELTSNPERQGVTLLAATNTPWDLDDALIRRFQRRIHVEMPDLACRKTLLTLKFKGTQTYLREQDINDLARKTEGFSSHDITVLAQDALLQPLRDLQEARWFKPVKVDGKDMWRPLQQFESPGSALASIPLELDDVPPDQIWLPPLSMRQVLLVLARFQPTVSAAQVERFQQFFEKSSMTHRGSR